MPVIDIQPPQQGASRLRPRPLVAVLVCLCAWTAVTASSHAQAVSAVQSGGDGFPASAWRAIAHGKPAEAEALAKQRPSADPDAAALLGHLAASRGRYDDAVAMLEPAAAKAPLSEAALELAVLQQQLGRTAVATRLFTVIARDDSDSPDPRAVLRAARAARALGRARDANALFRSAAAIAPNAAIDTEWGLLFLEKYNRPEAVKSFQQAIERDPEWAPAHAGLARTLAEDDPPAAAAAATRALAIDPHLADAQLMLAELDLDNTRWDSARERIANVLADNPSDLNALALSAAVTYVRDNRAAFDQEARKALAINPTYGEVYRVAGDFAARNYRFDEAVALAREAVTLDPSNSKAQAQLGMHLMRTGDEAEARKALERAFRDDPFDAVTYNLLALLDTLDTFVVLREGDIVLKLHPEEAPVLREYAMPFAQKALKTLSSLYGFTPKGPILVELFPNHDDFAVRNLGLPGMIGAVGACFGRVVTLDSPKARPPGTYSWQATLWHEMAHVITLQMSGQRIPRWLTEGISDYEEARARPEWGREMEVPFAMALEQGKAFKVRDLNSGFTRPDTIALAYYQSSLLVDHISRTYGEQKLQALVRSYAQGAEGEAAIEKSVGVSVDQLQASFDKALDAKFSTLRAALRVPASRGAQLVAASAGIDDLRASAAARPGSYQAQLEYGKALAAGGDRAAFDPLERAAALVPMAIGENSPHAIMGRLAEQLNDPARAIREYQLLLAQDHTAVDAARRLAELAAKSASPSTRATLLFAYDRVVSLDPFDAQAHTGLGHWSMESNDHETAIREFRAALAIGPADKAAAHCDLGEAYLAAGRAADAKKEALAALEIAPTFDRAQELLLKTIKTAGYRP